MDCPYAPDFVIVNLASQAEAVAAYVRGWPKEHILHWLGRQGDLVKLEGVSEEEVYSFRSRMGFEVTFLLDGDRFTFLGDNTTWKPRG
jgi:hypothetical protein